MLNFFSKILSKSLVNSKDPELDPELDPGKIRIRKNRIMDPDPGGQLITDSPIH